MKKRKNWSASFAYAIGLITADGCLSKDGRHIDFTSKDLIQVETFAKILKLNNKIGTKYRGPDKEKFYNRIQFGNIIFYRFLVEIGLSPNKSKTIGEMKIPDKYFQDFLRGVFDGDGNAIEAKHPESQHPQLRVRFFSASDNFIRWLHNQIKNRLEVNGFVQFHERAYTLTFAKADSVKIAKFMYYKNGLPYLPRKYNILAHYI
ncbi:hypothetical protein HY024_03720 [Candidatus Curtissbacteria bacterium]|nr:hypothetical protein [Candidatus Curtissbacteria bacterium]